MLCSIFYLDLADDAATATSQHRCAPSTWRLERRIAHIPHTFLCELRDYNPRNSWLVSGCVPFISSPFFCMPKRRSKKVVKDRRSSCWWLGEAGTGSRAPRAHCLHFHMNVGARPAGCLTSTGSGLKMKRMLHRVTPDARALAFFHPKRFPYVLHHFT